MKKFVLALGASVAAMLASSGAMAANVAIVQGGFYTTNLKNALVAKGHTVTEINSYTAASLAPFNAVIMYGNTFTDQSALSSYVNGGGRLVWTPWAGLNFSVVPALQVFTNGGSAVFTTPNPGVNVLAPANPLLTGVTFPAAGSPNVGFINGIGFAGGVTQIANWGNGTAMLGTATFGAGTIVGINLHVITSDTAYQVIDTPWGSQLLSNAVGAGMGVVPEPQSWAMLIAGFGLVGAVARRRRTATVSA